MTESCRLITTEQYKEWKASEKKLAELKQELYERFPYNCFTARLARERLQKKLDIAIRTLEDLELANDIRICMKAQETLKKMEEVK